MKPLCKMTLLELVEAEAGLHTLWLKLRNHAHGSHCEVNPDEYNHALGNVGNVKHYLDRVSRHIRERLGMEEAP